MTTVISRSQDVMQKIDKLIVHLFVKTNNKEANVTFNYVQYWLNVVWQHDLNRWYFQLT